MIILNRDALKKYLTPLMPIPTTLKAGGKLEGQILCILFDVYGTLFISASGDIGAAEKRSQSADKIQELLIKYDIKTAPQIVLHDFYAAIKKQHDNMRKKGVDCPEVEIDKIWMDVLKISNPGFIQKFAIEFELIVNPVYPMPHLKEMLAALRHRKMMMGIISNAQFYTLYLFFWYLNSDLKKLGFHPDLIFLSYRLKRAKPSLLLFDQAVKKLKGMGIRPSSVLYLGNDMLNDINPAGKVGFKTALFAGDARSLRLRTDDLRCARTAADLIITDLMQLTEYIQ